MDSRLGVVLERLASGLSVCQVDQQVLLEACQDPGVDADVIDALALALSSRCSHSDAGVPCAEDTPVLPVARDRLTQALASPPAIERRDFSSVTLAFGLPEPIQMMLFREEAVQRAVIDCIKGGADAANSNSYNNSVTDSATATFRAFVLTEACAAAERCWKVLDVNPIVNGAYESGSEAQRVGNRTRDWVVDELLASVLNACEDELNDCVSSAAFACLHSFVKRHPVCYRRNVDVEVMALLQGIGNAVLRKWTLGKKTVLEGEGSEGIGDSESLGNEKACVGNVSKLAYPLQSLCQRILRLALPRLRGMLMRVETMNPMFTPPAIRACTALFTCAIQLVTTTSGLPYAAPVCFMLFDGWLPSSSSTSSSISTSNSSLAISTDDSVALATMIARMASEWISTALVPKMDYSIEVAEAGAAAWGSLQLLQCSPLLMDSQLALSAPIAKCLVRLCSLGQAAVCQMQWALYQLNAGQEQLLAAAVLAVKWVNEAEKVSLLPEMLEHTSHLSSAPSRWSMLAELSFFILAQTRKGGRPASLTHVDGVLSTGLVAALVRPAVPQSRSVMVLREELVLALCTVAAVMLTSCTAASVGAETTLTSSSSTSGPVPFGMGKYSSRCIGVEGQWINKDDLVAWLQLSVLLLNRFNLCITWRSVTGDADAHAYVSLLALVLKLVCPVDVEVDSRGGVRKADHCGGCTAIACTREMKDLRSNLAELVDNLIQPWILEECQRSGELRRQLQQVLATYVAAVHGVWPAYYPHLVANGTADSDADDYDDALFATTASSEQLLSSLMKELEGRGGGGAGAREGGGISGLTSMSSTLPSSTSVAGNRQYHLSVAAHHMVVDSLIRLGLGGEDKEICRSVLNTLRADRRRIAMREQPHGPKGMKTLRAVRLLKKVLADDEEVGMQHPSSIALQAQLRRIYLCDISPLSALSEDRGSNRTAGMYVIQCIDRRHLGGGGLVASGADQVDETSSPPSDDEYVAMNGGSDPILLMAAHSVGYGKGEAGKITMYVRAYNATSGALSDGFTICLGAQYQGALCGTLGNRVIFAGGLVGESEGWNEQEGKLAANVKHVLQPGQCFTWKVTLTFGDSRPHFVDLVVHATVDFPFTERESEFEESGLADLMRGDGSLDTPGAAGGAVAAAAAAAATAAVPATLSGGQYSIPAVELLLPPLCGHEGVTWSAFRDLWGGGGLVYLCSLPVRTVLAMSSFCLDAEEVLIALGTFDKGMSDVRAASRVKGHPDLGVGGGVGFDDVTGDGGRGGATANSITAAWVLRSWQGTTVAVVMTALQQQAAGAVVTDSMWIGRMEIRAATQSCRDAIEGRAGEVVSFITSGTFEKVPQPQQFGLQKERFSQGVGAALLDTDSDRLSKTNIKQQVGGDAGGGGGGGGGSGALGAVNSVSVSQSLTAAVTASQQILKNWKALRELRRGATKGKQGGTAGPPSYLPPKPTGNAMDLLF